MEALLSLLPIVSIGTFMVYSMSIRRARRPQHSLPAREASTRLLSKGRGKLLLKLLDLGGFFGVDIGGTLSKIVFFLPDKELATDMLRRVARTNRSRLEEWYTKLGSVHQLAGFILSNDRYGATGVRDVELSFDMPDLGGSFHFIRFETRRMEGALKLARKHGLSKGMHTICATGGGAQKVGGVTGCLGCATGRSAGHSGGLLSARLRQIWHSITPLCIPPSSRSMCRPQSPFPPPKPYNPTPPLPLPPHSSVKLRVRS